MANEIQVVSSLRVINLLTGQRYVSQPTSFTQSLSNTQGPAPGYMTASVFGTNVDLSAFVQPGWCRIQNLDPTNKVHVGTWDSSLSKFFPLLQIKPTKHIVIELSSLLQEAISGTGTHLSEATTLRVKADVASCKIKVEAFEGDLDYN